MWMLPLPVPTPPAAIVGAESGQHSLARTPDSVDIAPGESVIAIKLDNPRNVSITLSLDDPVPTFGGAAIRCRVTPNGAGEALVAIRGAALRDELSLTLRMRAYDREYDPYTFTIRCPEYTVSFDNQGHGAPLARTAAPLFGTVSDPGNLTETGWFFGGWFKEPEGTTPWDFAADTVTGDTTLYAKWGIALSGTVSITGTAQWNQVLTANITSITPSAIASAYTYQWKRDGAAIGANSQTYTLTAADEAAIISVEVSRTGYASSITGVIAAAVDSIGGTGEAGGIIFYVDDGTYGGGTWKYLEAAPADIESSSGTRVTLAWASSACIPLGYGGAGDWISIGTQTGIGTGVANTAAILASAADPNAPAALACRTYRAPAPYDIFDDWFLPSKDELNAMYSKGIASAANGFVVAATSYYWSSSQSSQSNNQYASLQSFSVGSQNNVSKHFAYYVRAVRAF